MLLNQKESTTYQYRHDFKTQILVNIFLIRISTKSEVQRISFYDKHDKMA